MYLLSVPVILQALLIIHVVRNGRDRFWIYVLIFLPVAGGIAYLIVEVLPGIRRSRTLRTATQTVSQVVMPDRRLRELREAVEFSPTVANRAALAQELCNRGDFEEAADLYRACLSGPFDRDESLVIGLAHCHCQLGNFRECLSVLEGLKEGPSATSLARFELLRARAHEGLGQPTEAEESYRAAAASGTGLEYRYRLAAFLRTQGKNDEAYSLYRDILDSYKRMPRAFKPQSRQWVQQVEADLKSAAG